MPSQQAFDIDFVITWVDGDDERWRKEYAKYKGVETLDDVRFRDMGLLKYWFRLVDLHAPWVRKIFFVTEGHVPEWLNLDHPKLVHVRHVDYIPSEFLPVFSSHPIEINLHRIEGISEHFVYFNDDMFMLKDTPPTIFFDESGLPRDSAVMNAISGDGLAHIIINDIAAINRFFSKKEVIKSNFKKWFSIHYGPDVIRNLLLMPWPNFTGFFDYHLPAPYLKGTFEAVWDRLGSELMETSASRFRDSRDLNQYVFRYWQLVTGAFSPIARQKIGFYTEISSSIDSLNKLLVDDGYYLGCVNDSAAVDFFKVKDELVSIFDNLAPRKSGFEV